MIAGLRPPPDWRDRDDAAAFGDAVARLAFAEADVLRCEERLVVAPREDYERAFALDTPVAEAREIVARYKS